MAKKSIKKQPVKTEVKKPSIYFTNPVKGPSPVMVGANVPYALPYDPYKVLKTFVPGVTIGVNTPTSTKKSDAQRLNDDILLRQIYAESAFNPNAVSKAGYKGLGQIGSTVIDEYKKATGVENVDPFNINDNLAVQKWAMNNLYNASFINKPDQDPEIRLAKTLAAYNWGRGHLSDYLNEQKNKGVDIYNSKDWINGLPKETKDYIEKILYKSNDEFNEQFKKAIEDDKYKNIISKFNYNPDKVVIDDDMGQWKYPGEVTRISSNDITMKGVPYPVLGVGADGEQRMMYPEEEHTFNQGPVTEYPMMQAKDGGWLSQYQNAGPVVKPVIPPDVMLDATKFAKWMKDHPESRATAPETHAIPITPRVAPEVLEQMPISVRNRSNTDPLISGAINPIIDYSSTDPRSQAAMHPLDYEEQLSARLGYPNIKGHQQAYMGVGEDEKDNARHSFTGMYTAQAIRDYLDNEIANTAGQNILTRNPIVQGVTAGAGALGASVLGLGHEASTYLNDGRWSEPTDRYGNPMPWYKRAYTITREGLEDQYNNMVGATLGTVPGLSNEQREAALQRMIDNDQLPDGYGETNVFGPNTGGAYTKNLQEHERGGVTWLNEYADGGKVSKVSKEELEYLQSVAAEDFKSNPRNTEIDRQKAELTKKTQLSETSLNLEKEIAKQSLLSKLRELSGKNQEPTDYYRGSSTPKEKIKNNYIYVNPGDKVATTTEGTIPRIKPVNAVDDGIFLAFADAVNEYKELYPNRPVPRISSGLRTRAEQEQLYANRANNRYPVAKPGTSKHELGKALDIVFDGGNDSDYQRLAALMSPRGFKWLGDYDKVHFEVDPNYPKTDISENGNVIITNQMPSMQLDVNRPVARSFQDGGWLNEYSQGGKTFTAGGEKHKVYKKESPTGNGKGVKGHIMVTHPTTDKGKWDTIDLTKIAGAKTVTQGVAATKKWHKENPEYQTGGPTTRYSYVLDDNNGNTVFDDNGNPIIINPTTNYTVPDWLPQVNITAPRIIPSSGSAGSAPQSNGSLAADIALDGMQFIPGPLGAAASAVGVGKNLYEGDYVGAGLDLANLVTMGGAKWLTLASDLANAAGKANKAGRLAKQSKILEHASNPNLWKTTGTIRDLAKIKTTDSNSEYKNKPKKAPNLLGKKDGGWLNSYK